MRPSLHLRFSWPLRRQTHRHKRGQAIVELALAFTFLSYLFAAAIDLGLAFKAYQALISSTAEASNYLTQNPLASCNTTTQGADCPITVADSEARTRFRGEQGDTLGRYASTLDLDASDADDRAEMSSGAFQSFISSRVQIDEADSTQVTLTDTSFGVGSSFNPSATNAGCQARKNFSSGQCFIVIRSSIDYKPFALAPALGSTMTIRSISVQPIVNGQP